MIIFEIILSVYWLMCKTSLILCTQFVNSSTQWAKLTSDDLPIIIMILQLPFNIQKTKYAWILVLCHFLGSSPCQNSHNVYAQWTEIFWLIIIIDNWSLVISVVTVVEFYSGSDKIQLVCATQWPTIWIFFDTLWEKLGR